MDNMNEQQVEIQKITLASQQKKKQQNNQRPRKKNGFDDVESFMSTRYLMKIFRFLGFCMPENRRALYLSWSVFINLSVTIFLPLTFYLSFITMSGEELETGNILTSVQVAINDLGCSTKLLVLGFFLPQLLKCKPILRRLDKRCSTEEEMESIKSLIRKGNRIVVLFTISYLSYSSSTYISAVIFKSLPYNLYNPLFDSKASTLNFCAAFFIEMLLMNVACIQQVVNDTYAVIYVNILRTHLRILSRRIENMSRNTVTSLEENFEELKLCIIDQKNIIELYNIVAPIISITIFIQFTVTAIILSTTLVNILLFATHFAAVVASGFYVLAVIVEIFPLCYYAQCLIEESNCLSDVIFHSNWIDQDVRYRKMMIFFMHRSQCSLKFKAGKMFPITLGSFLTIAKLSFSFYTFIKKCL